MVVDDDPNARDLLAATVRREGYRVIEATDGETALVLAREWRPDAVTLDVLMPRMDGWAVLTALKSDVELAEIPVIIVTVLADRGIAVSLGAAEFLTKPTRPRDLLAAIRAAIERDRAAHQARRELDELRERYARLTGREREVMALVVAGRLNKQIAGDLSTSERTVKFHRAHIMEKMEADSVAELVRMAGQLGLVPQD